MNVNFNNFKNIKNYSFFQIKILLKKKSFYLLIFVPLLFMFTTMTIGTLELFYVGVFSGTFLISTLFIFMFFERDKEIYKKINISRFEKNISSLLITLFLNCILMIFIVFYFIVFSVFFNILNVDGEGAFSLIKNWNYSFSALTAAWGIVFYYIILFTLMAYSFYFLLISIFKNEKTFFLFSTSYIIFTILFGGVIGSYFDYNINLSESNILLGQIYLMPTLQSNLNFVFYVSNLFSFFFLNQFVYMMFLNVNYVLANNLGISAFFNFFQFYSIYWLFLILLPYLWIMFYFIVAHWFNKKKLSKI
ncbi:MAG: hypothetical protein HPAVJP_1190 [Candidatus Hepatoplasma vulgare]|nr:MAG: hypothetical protein HPAVJP_1190 [Candidatus Hepatoplasma sp.]